MAIAERLILTSLHFSNIGLGHEIMLPKINRWEIRE